MRWMNASKDKPPATQGAKGEEPCISDDVLVYFPSGESCYDVANYDHRAGTWHLPHRDYMQPDVEPDYWMELPFRPGEPIPIDKAPISMQESITTPCRGCGKTPLDLMEFS